MTRFPLLTPLLLGACAAPLSPASAQPAGQPMSIPPALPNPSAPRIPIYVPTVMCFAAVRPSVSVKPRPLDAIRLAAGHSRSVSAGGFRFQASYGHGDDRRGPWRDHREFGTNVYLEPSGKLIEHVLFDQPFDTSGLPNGIVSHTATEHGFTGLHYVYAPSGAELQYWCTAE